MVAKTKKAPKATEKSVDQCLTEMRESVRMTNGEEFDAAQTERIGSPSIGDVVRQGDVYALCIAKLPEGKKTLNRQIVPGSTQGSRHTLEGDVEIVKDVTFERWNSVLVGPAFKCNSDVELCHPEHGNKILPKDSVWQTLYQQSFAEEIRRVQD